MTSMLHRASAFAARFIACSITCAAVTAQANLVAISGVPTPWRLQSYVPDTVNLYFTPSTCTYGSLSFPSSSTPADRNRFWSLILAAKLANRSVYIYYDDSNSPGACYISSFGMDG